jgi:hypothetical protein
MWLIPYVKILRYNFREFFVVSVITKTKLFNLYEVGFWNIE